MANKYFTALALLAVLGCAPQGSDKATADSVAMAAADPAVVQQALDAANAKGADALNKGDIDAFLANYAPDAVVMMPNAPAWRGTDAMRTGFQGLLTQFTASGVAFKTDDVKVAGDLAIETGQYEMTLTPKTGKAKPVADKGKYITVWQKQADGSWKIVRDISNSDLPPAG
jgi:uncharacterized protein (TIGR02246 family)